MPRYTWLFAGILAALVAAAIGFLTLREKTAEASAARAQTQAAVAAAGALARTNSLLAAELETLRSKASELEEQVKLAASSRDVLERQMRSELESREVTISELQGRLTVDILDRVLFDSGEADLKPEGQAVLLKVARILGQHATRQIQVVGHTDNVPVVNRTRGGFTDNWGLSAGRATAAVRFLAEKAGVDARRLSAVGCGEFRPVADNAMPEGRARNRRIAVVVLPAEYIDVPRPSPEAATPAPQVVRPGPPPATEATGGTEPAPAP